VAKIPSSASWQRALIILTGAVVGIIVIACLYWAQAVFIPVALAAYLTFLLGPLVFMLERHRLGRVLSVLIAASLVAIFLCGTGWVVYYELTDLVQELPKYSDNIKDKVRSLRTSTEGTPFEAIDRIVREITGELRSPLADGNSAKEASNEPPAGQIPAPQKLPAVAIQPESPPWLSRMPSVLSSMAEMLGTAALTVVLVLFMLLKREDLRNRLIRLFGHGRLTLTTKALTDASERLSRFLIMQAIVNGVFGLALAAGLLVIGVRYAFLWGFLAALLRYVPFVGIWIAALFPITLSLAMFPGWLQPALVVGLFLLIELISTNVMEPKLFGHSMGVSEVALLVTAAFWAFLWGPIGLILSNPMTVFLVVLGKYVPQLESFSVLLGDEPALESSVSFYQRLLARDQDEAEELVQQHAQAHSLEQVYDDLLIPALNFARRDRERDELTDRDEEFILRATREIVEDLGEQAGIAAESATANATANGSVAEIAEEAGRPTVLVLGCPARDDADELALQMLKQLLNSEKWEMEVAGVERLASELVALAVERKPAIICIGSLPPGGLAHTRYVCKRLRARLPHARIVVGRWGLQGNLEAQQEQLKEAGADEMETTLLATRRQLSGLLPVLAQATTQRAAEPVAVPPTLAVS
jgi:predicted PurR-regulated permease PerM